MDSRFPRVTEDKQKYALTKLNIIFMVSNLQIPFNNCKSSNSHKSEETYKSLAAGRGLLINDWRLRYQMAFGLTALSEREDKKDTAPFMFVGFCHSFSLNYTTGLHLVAIFSF